MAAGSDELRARILAILQGRFPLPTAAPQTHESSGGQAAQAIAPAPEAATGFSAFRPEQVAQAMEISQGFSATAAATPGNDGLSAVLDEAQQLMGSQLPAIVKYALLIFLTHDANGARLGVPGLEERHPAAIVSMVAAEVASSDPLAYFREDILANEHHEHWHLVYLANPTRQPHEKERQGELFIYMHEQMLARYDTERLAAGQANVAPLDPTKPIPEGYDPHWPGKACVPRADGASLPAKEAQELAAAMAAFNEAAVDGTFEHLADGSDPGARATGPQPGLDLLGSTIEAHGDAATSFEGVGVHNNGHDYIASIEASDGHLGVMGYTATAIRDPVFWRWHRLIDDAGFSWQENQGPRDFSKSPDAPPAVLIRSQDVILATAGSLAAAGFADIHDEEAAEVTAQPIFGGSHWDDDFSDAKLATTTLSTQMSTRSWTPTIDKQAPGAGGQWPTQEIRYLDMTDEFAYLIRLENKASVATEVTVRVFIAADELAHDRRMWIELDKFLRTLQPKERRVIYRPSSLSSVVRKPAERPPGPPPTTEHNEPVDYCQCGWPYNLLLPRGTSAGMPFKLTVIVTDARYDKLENEHGCGGMSFCGVRDRYPDARNMGYPFDRPFAGADALEGVSKLPNAALRDLTIKAT